MPYAEVAVNAAAPIRQTFTYRVPEGMTLRVGHGVYVPFGSRRLQGIVLDVTEEAAFPDARDVDAIIDPEPLLSPERAALARWLSDHYLAPLFDCVSLMLPPGFKRRPLTILRPLVSVEELPRLPVTERQREVLAHLVGAGETEQEQLRKTLRNRNIGSAVNALLLRGFIDRRYELARPQVRPKVVPHLRLLIDPEDARRRASQLRQDGKSAGLRRAMVLQALADE